MVVVMWSDAWTLEGEGWSFRTVPATNFPTATIGFVVRVDADGIVLAQSVTHDIRSAGLPDLCFDCLFAVPYGVIRNLCVVGDPWQVRVLLGGKPASET
jgi:hypothetical protein